MSCTPRLTMVNGIPKWEESCKIRAFMGIFLIGKHLPKQEIKVGFTLL